MAEGWARHLLGGLIETHGLNLRAVKVMTEAGVDISGHTSKGLSELSDRPFDVVITVCDNAKETCPVFPGWARVMHRSFDDPPTLAREAATEKETLDHYRRVRDEIMRFIEGLPEYLDKQA